MSLNLRSNFGPAIKALEKAAQLNTVGQLQILRQIGAALSTQIQFTWLREENPYGVKWARLAPYTVARRRAQGRGSKILRDTGAAIASVAYTITNRSLSVGVGKAYMLIHQRGDPVLKIPKRATMPDDDKDLPRTWDAIILEETQAVLRQYGFV